MATNLDRITLEVIGSALLSIAEEMGEALIKASYSSNIKERQDCSTAVFNLSGEVVAQAEHIPMHLGSLIMIVREILARYPLGALRDGDVFVGNDPYTGGSTHLPDITVASPVFHRGEPVGFVANIAHHADGSGGQTRTIWDEGLRIPPIRVVEGGVLRDDVMELLLLNFRLPRERRGDFRAQFATNRIGAERMCELLERYGRDTCTAAMTELLAYGERKIRAALRRVPDGVYRFEDVMDDDGADGPPVPVRVAITVAGEEIALDFAGTGPQVPGDINVVYLALVATVYYALKALLDPTIPANGGFYRAIRVDAPEGSIVNALPPAPVAWRTQTCQRIADVIFGALAPALPDDVIAATNGANSAWVFSGVDPRTGGYYVYLETIGGGSGARARKDGLDGVQVHITNTSNLPVECLEMEYPLLVEEYSLVPDSGGPGRWRGGLGLRRTIRVHGGEATFLGTLDRARVAPWGLFGGRDGGKAALVLNAGADRERALPPKIAGLRLAEGDAVTIVTPGAGGYGPPSERARDLIARDVREGKTSPAVAGGLFDGFTRARIATPDVAINTVHGGHGPPVLLLHGWPQTHVMWHKIAVDLARDFTVVVTDLRGYGDSDKPAGGGDHGAYSRRVIAQDQVSVMARLGFETFAVVGHDRGGRVGHRMALDHPGRVTKLAVLDIAPTLKVYQSVDQKLAMAYWHWFFMRLPAPIPETIIGNSVDFLLGKIFELAPAGTFTREAVAEYVRCFRDPASIHAGCEDYRAAGAIDLLHDQADLEQKVSCPLLVLWGEKGMVHPFFDGLAVWRERAIDVSGRALPGGHFLPEERPAEVLAELRAFLGS